MFVELKQEESFMIDGGGLLGKIVGGLAVVVIINN